MKLSNKYVENEMVMFTANYIICFILALLTSNQDIGLFCSQTTMILGAMSGVLYLTSFMLMKFNMKENGVVMTSTFMKLGVLIPTLIAIVLFKEVITINKSIGIILGIIAIIIFYYEKDAYLKGNKKWLIALLIGGGICDAMATIFEHYGQSNQEAQYLFITFLIASLCALSYAYKRKEQVKMKDLLAGIMIGIPNFFSSKFLLGALAYLDAIVVYPTYSIVTLVVIALFGVILFKEKLNIQKIIAFLLVIIAILLLNV